MDTYTSALRTLYKTLQNDQSTNTAYHIDRCKSALLNQVISLRRGHGSSFTATSSTPLRVCAAVNSEQYIWPYPLGMWLYQNMGYS
jgi:hypothetical protein